MRKLQYKAGYHLRVRSWENDGDNYNTSTVAYDTLDEAMCMAVTMKTLFKSRSAGKQFFGNTAEGEVVDKELLESYNSIRHTYNQPLIELDEDGYQEWDELYNLLGYSEWYDFRVCESVRLFHYPEDVYAEELEVT